MVHSLALWLGAPATCLIDMNDLIRSCPSLFPFQTHAARVSLFYLTKEQASNHHRTCASGIRTKRYIVRLRRRASLRIHSISAGLKVPSNRVRTIEHPLCSRSIVVILPFPTMAMKIYFSWLIQFNVGIKSLISSSYSW